MLNTNFWENYDKISTISVKSYEIVYKGLNKKTGKYVLIKEIDKTKYNIECHSSFKKEEIIEKIKDIQELIMSIDSKDYFYIVMELFLCDLEYYITGDIGYITNEGFLCVLGREDDVIKVAGHRLSTGRIEEVLNEVEGVIECAAVGMKDKIKGEVPVAFIVVSNSNSNNNNIIEKCYLNVINKIGRISALKKIIVVKKLPKNKSGKIIRKLLKNVINNEKIFIPPTIEDKFVVSDILKEINKFKL